MTRNVMVAVGTLVVVSGAVATALVTRNDSRVVTIPAGTTLVGTLDRTVSTEQARVGDPVELTISRETPLGSEVIPAGGTLRGEVTHLKGGGRISGSPELTLRFTRLELDGNTRVIDAEPFYAKGGSDAKESAATIGGGAAAGGLIGAILGGGKGAVKGAVVGGAAGTGVAVATKGDRLVLPAGRTIRVRLRSGVEVKVATASARERGDS